MFETTDLTDQLGFSKISPDHIDETIILEVKPQDSTKLVNMTVKTQS